jgi:ubiquinone/menaquinone biosynthesis C-methylase UbiE
MRKIILRLISPFLSVGDKKVAETALHLLKGYFSKGDNILDLGCGSGMVGDILIKNFKVNLLGLDVDDYRVTNIPFKKADGTNMPFKENTFDDVCIFYVLHHTVHANKILEEAKRVSRRRIYILEDTPKNLWEKNICNLHGLVFNFLFDLKNAYKTRSKEELIHLFKEQKLKIIYTTRISCFNPIYNPTRTFFVLAKE